jgi:hypothetical protein
MILQTCEDLPLSLPFSDELNDFIFKFLTVQSITRLNLFHIAKHSWLQGGLNHEIKPHLSVQISTEVVPSNSDSSIRSQNNDREEKRYSPARSSGRMEGSSLPPIRPPKTPCVKNARKMLLNTNDEENE